MRLSKREMEVVSHLLKGETNKKIAYLLGVKDQTVKNEIHNILVKTGLENRTQIAVLYSYKPDKVDELCL